MSFSFTDRENLWIQAGGDPAVAPLAAAISMAENTSGDPNVVSGTNDVGLWQINLNAHPQYDLAYLQNPLNNARAAVQISDNGGNWKPWVAYTNGSYRKFLGGSGTLETTLSTSSSCSSGISLPNFGPFGGGQLCMDGPIGLGALVLGGLVAIVGFIILSVFTLESDVGRTVIRNAGPIGRIASSVAR